MAYGTVNADVIGTSVANTSLGAGNASLMKNRIINGAMVIDQRGSAATPANTGYATDRWAVNYTTINKFNAGQSTSAPSGFINSLVATSLSAYSLGSGDTFYMAQVIEGLNIADLNWGTASAQTVTVSFWVKSSLTGTFGGAVINSAANYSYTFNYSIAAANTWTYVSTTIPGPTSGTWLTTNGSGITLRFGLGTGPTYTQAAGSWGTANAVQPSGNVSLVATNGATWYLTGVQLEVGSSATGYEYRQYTTELCLCQRYYWKFLSVDAFATMGVGSCDAPTGDECLTYVKLPVTMRSQPTANYSTLRIADGSVGPAVTSIVSTRSNYNNLGIYFGASSGGLTLGRCGIVQGNNSTTAYIDASAEL